MESRRGVRIVVRPRTAREQATRVGFAIGGLAALQFYLNSLESLLPAAPMGVLWAASGTLVLLTTVQIEKAMRIRRPSNGRD